MRTRTKKRRSTEPSFLVKTVVGSGRITSCESPAVYLVPLGRAGRTHSVPDSAEEPPTRGDRRYATSCWWSSIRCATTWCAPCSPPTGYHFGRGAHRVNALLDHLPSIGYTILENGVRLTGTERPSPPAGRPMAHGVDRSVVRQAGGRVQQRVGADGTSRSTRLHRYPYALPVNRCALARRPPYFPRPHTLWYVIRAASRRSSAT